jgi:hypothetical protein
MRNASSQGERETFECGCCGRVVVVEVAGVFSNPGVGSPRRFCDAACRQAAWRRRRAGVAENTPAQRRGGRGRGLGGGAESATGPQTRK